MVRSRAPTEVGRRGRRQRSQPIPWRGQSLVELAMILPLMLVLIIGVMELGIAFYKNSALAHATRKAIRRAALNRSTRTEITDTVINNAVGIPVSSSEVTITTAAADSSFPGNPPSVTIAASHTHQFLVLPLIGVNTFTLSSTQSSTVLVYPGKENVTF